MESNLPRLWLSWHYRSQHESLIAFSNHEVLRGPAGELPAPARGTIRSRASRGGASTGSSSAAASASTVSRRTAIVDEIRARLATDRGGLDRRRHVQHPAARPDPGPPGGVRGRPRRRSARGRGRGHCSSRTSRTSRATSATSSCSRSRSPRTRTRAGFPLNFGPLDPGGRRATAQRRRDQGARPGRAVLVVRSGAHRPQPLGVGRPGAPAQLHGNGAAPRSRRGRPEAGNRQRPTPRRRRRRAPRGGAVRARARGLSDFTVDIAVAPTEEGPGPPCSSTGPTYAKRATVGDRESLPHGVLVGFMGWSRVERIWLPDWVREPRRSHRPRRSAPRRNLRRPTCRRHLARRGETHTGYNGR